MLRSGFRSLLVLLIVFTTFKCIDPYFPRLSGYEPVLVVDGLITNDNQSYIVRLSYTKQYSDSVTKKISDANVYITDETGANTLLTSIGDGIYKTDSLLFKGEVGKTYQLHIKTSNGNDYASDSCTMQPVPEIDSVYFAKDVRLLNNQSVTRQGLSIYIDTKQGIDDKYFLRWDFDENWKFKVVFPTKYDYLNDTTILLLPASQVKEFCYKSAISSEITTGAVLPGQSNLKGQPVQFISPELSDRLSMRYTILIKQYSLSQKEYDYWNNLKEVSETQGDIFGSQPFAVLSNVRNVNNSSEQVLGYFQVSAVVKRREYINFDQVISLNLPLYHYSCTRISMSPSEYPRTSPYVPPITWDGIYTMYAKSKGYSFVEPLYDPLTLKLLHLYFSTTECTNCEVTGTSSKPDFWTDN